MPGARPRALAAVTAAALALAAAGACAQAVYRWTDAEGKVHYSDHLPKDYTGPVTRIETDKPAEVSVPPAPGVTIIKPPKRTELAAPPVEDIGTKRRETRERLEERVNAARENLAAARKAREQASGTQDDEQQVIRRTMEAGQQGVARSNCTSAGKDANGHKLVMCPSLVPGDAYYERIGKLDDAVAKAEKDLADAQEAYRRGVD